MRRMNGRGLLAFSLALCVVPQGLAGETLKIASPIRGSWEGAIPELGQQAGIFRKHGLDLEILYTQGGGETMQVVVSGAVDIGLSAGTLGTLGAYGKGAPVRVQQDHRGFLADALRIAPNVAIEHQVAHDQRLAGLKLNDTALAGIGPNIEHLDRSLAHRQTAVAQPVAERGDAKIVVVRRGGFPGLQRALRGVVGPHQRLILAARCDTSTASTLKSISSSPAFFNSIFSLSASGRASRRRAWSSPTSSSWLNLVERWFRNLTDKAIRRGVFRSVPDLVAAIEDYLKANNDDPKPFVWTATADHILAKVARGRVALQQVKSQ